MAQINIAGTLHNTEEIQGDALNSHVVAHADEILDTTKEKKQSEVNADVDTALADRYTKEETYSKTELDNLITTPDVQYVTVTASAQTTSVTDVLPATGAADTIYRVGSWDGSAFDAGKYSEYAWNGSAYQLLAVRSGSLDGVFDISENNLTEGQPTQYADLAAALNSGSNVPEGVRAGGMSVRFINSDTHKYEQWRYLETDVDTATFANVANWQGVDETPTAGSQNLVTSGGAYSINEKLGKVEVPFNYEKSYYAVTKVGDIVNVSSPSSGNNYRCLVSEISAGDSVFVTGSGGSTTRLWAFLDSTYTVLSIAGINAIENNVEHIAPTNSAYFIIDDKNTGGKIYKRYKTSIETQIANIENAVNEKIDYLEYKNLLTGIQYKGQLVGEALTEASVAASVYLRIPVSVGDSFILNSPYSSSFARTWYFVNHITEDGEEKDIAVDFAKSGVEDTNKLLITPVGANILIIQGAVQNPPVLKKLGCYPNIDLLNKYIATLKSFDDKECFKGSSRFLESSLAKTYFADQSNPHFTNIGFIGDSWTEGKYAGGYTQRIALILQEKYGYGGLGWLDLTKETGVGSSSFIYGAASEGIGYSVSLINANGIATLDGSTSTTVARQCLGPCCAHSTFANGSGVNLTFDSNILDKFNILYYKNAHFTVSINGGEPVEITANSSDGLQSHTFSDVNGITSVVITSVADNTVIFGMDCFYGNKGLRVHKFGNGSSKAEHFLAMDETQFEDEMAYFSLDWVSVEFGLNDFGSACDPNVANGINNNIVSLCERIKNAYTIDEQAPEIDINLFNVYAVTNNAFSGMYLLYKPQRESAIASNWGFFSTKQGLGEPLDSTLFSDGVHLNNKGWYMIAKALEKTFFNF